MRYLTILFLIILLFFVYNPGYGQGAPKPIVGVKGGINLANIGGDTDNSTKLADHLGRYSEVFFDYFLMV